MKNKTLLVIFTALLGIYVFTHFFSGKQERSFKSELVQIDTASVTSIALFPKAENGAEILLKREGNTWIATKGDVITKAQKPNVDGILSVLNLVKTKRVAAKSPEKWAEYEVDETNGSRVKVFAGSKLLEDIIIGRFGFNQQKRTATSFVRLEGEDEVYAIDGFLSMTLNPKFNAFRDKQLVKLNKENVTGLAFSGGQDASATYSKMAEGWMKDEGLPVDSTQMESFLSGLENISGAEFVDSFDPVQATGSLQQSLAIMTTDQPDGVIISCYRDSTAAKPFILQSNLNPDGYFASDSTGIYSKFFGEIQPVIE